MILGGQQDIFNVLKSVELYNWQTGEQCTLGDLPYEVSAHSGTEIDGVPVFCGGIKDEEDQSECYKYNHEADSWEKIADLLVPISWAGDVYVPNQGWVIFGGGPAEFTTSQKLTTVDGAWENGPKLHTEDQSDHGLCALQISETVSGFFGGNINNHSIVTYDWATESYTQHPTELQGERLRSSCALLKGKSGEDLVAVVGSDSDKSKGMEAWNPADESLTTLHEELPHEKDGLGLDGSQMFSINDRSELILYGGFAGVYLADIWKYSVADDSWNQVGNMTTTRYGHVVIPVTNVKCPPA